MSLNICGAVLPDGISPYLKVYITDLSNGDFVVGYIGDGASASLSAEWSSPFQGIHLGSMAGAAANTAGSALSEMGGKKGGLFGSALSGLGSLMSKGADLATDAASFMGVSLAATINSAMVWQGQQPPQFSIPIYLLAHSNPYLEVQQPIRVLQQMASPELNEVSPGGRVPSKVTLDIGRRIKLSDCIITEVTYELDAPRNADGFFIQNNVTLQMSGWVTCNRSDFDNVFI